MAAGFLAAAICLAAAQTTTLRGKLTEVPGKAPVLATADGRSIPLAGDPETTGVVHDKRLNGADLEITGHFTAPDQFTIDPFTTRGAMYVHKDGKKYTISYWCPVCSIRTYSPGKCMCCQQETHLDLEEAK